MVQHIHSVPEEQIGLEINRDGNLITKRFKTTSTVIQTVSGMDTVGFIGIGPAIQFYDFFLRLYYISDIDINIFQASLSGINSTMSGFGLIVMSIKMLISREASIKELGGPIMIAQLAGETAKAGMPSLLSFMALISINLAFLNILPIPGLDGGHIFITVIQAIIRKPLSIKTRMIFQQIGMAILLLLMITVLYNDIGRLFTN
tara:strand:- start:274 stop:882 length:609 start_codon:yes stop_codon:yes gene_type:complete